MAAIVACDDAKGREGANSWTETGAKDVEGSALVREGTKATTDSVRASARAVVGEKGSISRGVKVGKGKGYRIAN